MFIALLHDVEAKAMSFNNLSKKTLLPQSLLKPKPNRAISLWPSNFYKTYHASYPFTSILFHVSYFPGYKSTIQDSKC